MTSEPRTATREDDRRPLSQRELAYVSHQQNEQERNKHHPTESHLHSLKPTLHTRVSPVYIL